MIEKPTILPVEPIAPFVLDYARRKPTSAIPFLVPLHLWQKIAKYSVPFMFAGLVLPWPIAALGVLGLAAFGLAGTFVLINMTKMAAREVDRAYAVRHLILAILLTPVVFLGVFLVPKLVEWDAIKWRQQEQEAAALNRE